MKPLTIIIAASLSGCCITQASDEWLAYEPDDDPVVSIPAPALAGNYDCSEPDDHAPGGSCA